jgi:hypothetical protein
MKKVNIGILVVGGIVASLLLGMYGVQTSHAAASFAAGSHSGGGTVGIGGFATPNAAIGIGNVGTGTQTCTTSTTTTSCSS